MMKRTRVTFRRAVGVGLTLLVPLAGFARASRAEVPDPDARDLVRVEAAVDRALEFLAAKQQPDGSWPQGVSPKPNTGVSGLCTLAFMGRGHVPGRGPYVKTVALAIEGLRDSRQKDGLLCYSGGNSHGPMYEHALASLALIEASGWMTDPALRETLKKRLEKFLGKKVTDLAKAISSLQIFYVVSVVRTKVGAASCVEVLALPTRYRAETRNRRVTARLGPGTYVATVTARVKAPSGKVFATSKQSNSITFTVSK